MKAFILTATFLFSSFFVLAQNNIENYIKEGIKYHDSGDYEKAILEYKKALKLDSKSTVVNYELALS